MLKVKARASPHMIYRAAHTDKHTRTCMHVHASPPGCSFKFYFSSLRQVSSLSCNAISVSWSMSSLIVAICLLGVDFFPSLVHNESWKHLSFFHSSILFQIKTSLIEIKVVTLHLPHPVLPQASSLKPLMFPNLKLTAFFIILITYICCRQTDRQICVCARAHKDIKI